LDTLPRPYPGVDVGQNAMGNVEGNAETFTTKLCIFSLQSTEKA